MLDLVDGFPDCGQWDEIKWDVLEALESLC